MTPDPSDQEGCAAAARLIEAEAQGHVPTAAERDALAAHRAQCPACRLEVRVAGLLRAPVAGGPPDDLDDLARRRLVQAIVDRADATVPEPDEALPPARRWTPGRVAALAAALAVLAAGGGLWWARTRAPASGARDAATGPALTARLAGLEGRVRGPEGLLRAGARLAEGATLVAETGRAVVALEGGGRVVLEPGTTVRLVRLSRADDLLLALEGGGLLVDLPPGPGRTFAVDTRGGRVEVTGTVFGVRAEADRTVVVVRRGAVRLVAPDQPILRVRAGEAGEFGGGGSSVRPARPEEARAWDDAATLAARDPGKGTSPSAQAVAGSEVAPPVPPPLRTPPLVTTAPPRAPVDPRPPTPAAWLALAQDRLAALDGRGAAAAYRGLLAAHGEAGEAQVARIGLARLLLAQLADPAGALKLCDAYLARAPRGALAPEAAYCRIQALERLGRVAEERVACLAFLRDHPQALVVPLVRRRLAALREPSP